MKRTIIIAAMCSAALLLAVSCKNSSNNNEAAQEEEEFIYNGKFKVSEEKVQEPVSGEEQAEEEQARQQEEQEVLPAEPMFDIVTSMGSLRIKLYEKTPAHRDNFVKLAKSGFYNGILFHRVINGFMIQGGDPLSKDPSKEDMWGTGGPGYTVPAEFVSEYRHKKGALAAARRGDAANPMRESSGSQFYLVQDESACASLDGQYTVFGETVSGIDVIDKIASVPVDRRDRPVEAVKILSVTLVRE